MGVFGGISKIGGRDEASYLSFSTPACTVVAIIYRWITRSQIARAIGLHGRLSSFVSGAIYRLIIDWSCRRAGQFYLRPSENNKKKSTLSAIYVCECARTFALSAITLCHPGVVWAIVPPFHPLLWPIGVNCEATFRQLPQQGGVQTAHRGVILKAVN